MQYKNEKSLLADKLIPNNLSFNQNNYNIADTESIVKTLADKYSKNPKRTGNGFMTHCPAHDDENGSLSIKVEGGKLLVHCHAGCDQKTVFNQVIKLASNGTYRKSSKKLNSEIVYPYKDTTGKTVLEKVRLYSKSFYIRQPNGSGGYVKDKDGKHTANGADTTIIYCLPEIRQAIADDQTIYIVEGEKDVNNVTALGLSATCNIYGASQNCQEPKWTDAEAKWLKGAKEVVIFPDNDASGEAHALAIARSLYRLGIKYKIVRLPGLEPKGDISDWLSIAGNTKEKLLELVASVPFHDGSEQTISFGHIADSEEDKTPFEFKGIEQTDNGTTDFDNSWPEFKPLFRELPPGEEFPLDALGPILAPAAKAIAKCVQVPLAIAGQSVLATANLATQPHIDVLIDGRRFPVSEFFATGADSGDRKTSADKQALRPVREFEEEAMKKYESEIDDIRLKHAVWKSEYEKIMRQKPNQIEKLAAIKALGEEPKIPIEPCLTLGDITVEGVRSFFKDGRSTVGVFTNEGATILNGWSMLPEQQAKTGAALSSAWDGEAIKLVRATEKLILLYGRRMCANFFAQPDILKGLLFNILLLKQGLLSRILATITESIAGDRPYNEDHLILNEAGYKNYCSTINELMYLPLPVNPKSAVLNPRAISPDKAAKSLYIQFYNAVEKEMKSAGKLANIKAFASKCAEHSLRLAATIQFIQQAQTGVIQQEATAGGIELAQFYLNETLRLNSVGAISNDLEMAATLWSWLKGKKKQFFCTIEVYENGPPRIRDASTARRYLNILVEHGIVRRTTETVMYRDILRKECWELRQDV